MSKVCAITGKGPLSGNKRSHSMRASRRNWNVNLQKVKVVVDGKPQTIRISARALKTLKNKKSYLRVDMKQGNLFFLLGGVMVIYFDLDDTLYRFI